MYQHPQDLSMSAYRRAQAFHHQQLQNAHVQKSFHAQAENAQNAQKYPDQGFLHPRMETGLPYPGHSACQYGIHPSHRLRKGDHEVRVTANGSCTLPTVSPQSLGVLPARPPPSCSLPSVPAPPPYHHNHMDLSERSRSITRLLQHSILQLCNEHVGYSHKLQILGVLCMTVDDEQHELVVKVNNTLKRVNPPVVPIKDSPPILQSAAAPVPPTGNYPLDPHSIYRSQQQEVARTASPPQSLPSQTEISSHDASQHQRTHSPRPGTHTPAESTHSPTDGLSAVTPSRKSHGRKGANPVKVQQVYDEGELMSSEDDHVMTVIPTDPESVYDNPSREMSGSHGQDLSSVDQQRPRGSAKRKASHQYHNSPLGINNHISPPFGGSLSEDSGQSSVGAAGRSISAVRALLLGRANSGMNSSGVHDLSNSHRMSANNSFLTDDSRNGSIPRGLTLPVFVAPQNLTPPSAKSQESPQHMNGAHRSGDSPQNHTNGAFGSEADNQPTNLSLREETNPETRVTSPSAFDSELMIKEEPGDEYMYAGYGKNSNNNNNNSSGSMDTSIEDFSQHLASIQNYAQTNGGDVSGSGTVAQLLARTSDGLPTQVPYTLAFSTSTPNKHPDGLSIQYTPTGPITVGKNGKNMSQPGGKGTKVKDIILYDDSSPLHEQRGNRIETDFMLDSFGLEGRKRRRRNADETLSAEEIAEYMGTLDMACSSLFKCKYCTEEMTSLTQYLQHTLSMHHCYICHQCGKSFTTKSSLLRHRPIHTGMRRFACSICKKTFYRKDKCKAHIKRHLGETGEQAECEPCDQAEDLSQAAVPGNLASGAAGLLSALRYNLGDSEDTSNYDTHDQAEDLSQHTVPASSLPNLLATAIPSLTATSP